MLSVDLPMNWNEHILKTGAALAVTDTCLSSDLYDCVRERRPVLAKQTCKLRPKDAT